MINMPTQVTRDTLTRHISSHFSLSRTINGVTAPHYGVDITYYPLGVGSPIYAAMDGRVLTANMFDNQAAGKFIRIDHGDNIHTRYLHLDTVRVNVGQFVRAGELIGTMGWTGQVIPKDKRGTHLHFELIVNKNPIDPVPYLMGTRALRPSLVINGRRVNTSVKVAGGRTYVRLEGEYGFTYWVQLRALAELLSAVSLTWDQPTLTASMTTRMLSALTGPQRYPRLVVNNRIIDTDIKITGGRLYVLLDGETLKVWVQIRALSDLLSAHLSWDQNTATATMVVK